MKLIFGAASTPGSWLIRLFTASRYSHVGVVFGDEVIEAHFPRVRSISLDEFIDHYPRHEFAELPCRDEATAEAWIRSRIGNLYDMGGLLAIPFRRASWQSNKRDFCSEMPILAALAGGSRYVRPDEANRITPQGLLALSFQEGEFTQEDGNA